MHQIYLLFNKKNYLKTLYILIFYLFVSPYSVSIDNQGVSVNYLFVLFPIFVMFTKRVIAWPPKSVIVFMGLLSSIYFFGAISQFDDAYLFFRQNASFLSFMSIFALMFVKLDQYMIESFKFSIIIYSLFHSSLSVIEFISLDGNNAGIYAKGLFGSQRIGFIYLLGFWLTIMLNVKIFQLKILKYIVAYMILVGIFLTFTRASILGLVVSLAVFFIYSGIIVFKETKSISTSCLKIFLKFLNAFIMFLLVVIFFKGPVQFYSNSIFTYIFSSQAEFIQNDELMLNTSFNSYQQFQLTRNKKIDNIVFLQNNKDFLDSIYEKVYKSKELELFQNALNKAEKVLNSLNDIDVDLQNVVAKDLINKSTLENSSDSVETIKKNEIYQENLQKRNIAYQNVLNQQSKVRAAQNQVSLTLNRLLIIELQRYLLEVKRYLNRIEDQNIILEQKKQIIDIELLIQKYSNNLLDLSNKQDSKSAIGFRMKDKGTSLGYRVYMHNKVLDYIYEKPFTGSSFFGVWILFDNYVGSAHSQYLDVLFRVGILAFVVYLLFLFKITSFLSKLDLGLFLGFIGFLSFGFFHETIKLSQGGFVFAFLFAMWTQRQRLLKENG